MTLTAPTAVSVIGSPQIDEAFLAEGLQEVLPPMLVGATGQAQEIVPHATGVREDEAGQSDLPSFAAALGAAAAGAVSHALIEWLSRRKERSILRLPNWLRPSVAPTAQPTVVTLTDFTNSRSRYIRLVENGEPVLISRHGTVVAAVIPVEAGAYEEAVYPAAARLRHAQRLERRALAPNVSPLSDEQLAEMASADDSSVAARYGVDTTGWEQLNPADSAEA